MSTQQIIDGWERGVEPYDNKKKITARPKRVLIDCGNGLVWRWWFQAYVNGKPIGYPQKTRALAKAWALS